jgi:hypothetical protein
VRAGTKRASWSISLNFAQGAPLAHAALLAEVGADIAELVAVEDLGDALETGPEVALDDAQFAARRGADRGALSRERLRRQNGERVRSMIRSQRNRRFRSRFRQAQSQ